MEYFKWDLPVNFFDYSDNKRYFLEPDVVKYERNSELKHDLIVGNETMKELGIAMDFKSQDNNHWWDHLAIDNINHVQGASTLQVLKLNTA